MEPFVLPEDLTALDAAALVAAETAALAAFDAIRAVDPADLTDEQVTELETLAAAVAKIRDEGARRETVAADRTARAEAAAATIAAPVEPAVEEEVVAEVVAEVVVDPVEVVEPIAAATDTVVASARRSPSLVTGMRQQPIPKPATPDRRLTITAGADIKGYGTGSALPTMLDTAKAFQARSDAFPDHPQGRDSKGREAPYPGEPGGPQPGIYMKHNVATMRRGDMDGLRQDNPDFKTLDALLAAAGDPNSLTAGGWCAPSETFYDLCAPETLDGIVDLPEVGLSRGGAQFTTGPQFSDIFSDSGFCQTEAQAIANTPKDCFPITCPPFEDVRLDACGICVEAPLLTRAAYPELIERTLSGVLVAHQHRIGARMIAAMQAAIGAPVVGAVQGSGSNDTLDAIELAALGLRYTNRLGRTQLLEVVAPFWLLAAIRSDMGRRTGVAEQAVTDAMIVDHFSARNLRVQFVYGYQDILTKCAVAWPGSVELMIYTAGAFVKGTLDIISLDTVYDSTNLKRNVYTAAFAEEGVNLMQRCETACRVTIDLCLAGRTGANDITCAPAAP